ncbi:copper resistance system multicopper oxidase [Ideonella alba]|jgi:CopA family copper-resistance protein|uniref:Copper resistance system multicopper oxidase n=1 Tax=Ideonella alba TaxID=2824118 RepID=A0A941BGW8_9BURK|nr:copper resistance system multicopper oxidase [Ideonella alba]MBI5271391.1 copper resistance system multicopper oxidase [Burkholderiales bacterium]MBQ0932522.1 copper resistance system multicopper oxidase [Ideonella alba]
MDPSKRRTLQTLAGLGALAALPRAWAQVRAVDLRDTPVSRAYDLTVAETPLNVTGKPAQGITINGTMPGPVLRFREGDEVVIRVTNKLREITGIHWHGLLVPNDQDGVPGVTYPGIRPGETFTYRFKLRQSGTYWYHSHAALQEAAGYFAPLIIEPAKPDPFQYDRDYVVVISDWIDTPPAQVLANLKKVDGYYNYRRVTAPQFFAQLRSAPDAKAREALWAERMEWAKMRMDPTDYSDGGDEWSFLLQGKRPGENWTGLFKPGERVRLRFINASPMNLYDVRIPGLPMTVVQADGQNVNPVEVDEFRIGNGETYDVIVQPKEAKAYTIFVPTIARIGYARGTLAPELGMSAPVPDLGPKPVRTMADMGMAGMDMGSGMADMPGMDMGKPAAAAGHAGMAMPAPAKPADSKGSMPGMADRPADPHAGMAGMGGMVDMPGMGAATPKPEPDVDGLRRLKYAHLRALTRNADDRAPEKEVLVRLTGDMARYFWGINDKKLSQAEPLEMGLGQRVRIKFVNETMMEHPMHLHGVFMELVNGNGVFAPRKHTIIVPPAQTVELDATFEDEGTWAFHCHLFYHAATGMMRLVKVA